MTKSSTPLMSLIAELSPEGQRALAAVAAWMVRVESEPEQPQVQQPESPAESPAPPDDSDALSDRARALLSFAEPHLPCSKEQLKRLCRQQQAEGNRAAWGWVKEIDACQKRGLLEAAVDRAERGGWGARWQLSERARELLRIEPPEALG